jgi:hypothetical protein
MMSLDWKRGVSHAPHAKPAASKEVLSDMLYSKTPLMMGVCVVDCELTVASAMTLKDMDCLESKPYTFNLALDVFDEQGILPRTLVHRHNAGSESQGAPL